MLGIHAWREGTVLYNLVAEGGFASRASLPCPQETGDGNSRRKIKGNKNVIDIHHRIRFAGFVVVTQVCGGGLARGRILEFASISVSR